MLGIYNYTVILTYFGMLTSFAGLTFAMNGSLRTALICLMISGVCDMFDGKIASTMVRTRQEKRFGVQIDSLSDLICFGMLPAAVTYRIANGSRIAFYIGALYLLCALIRLAWFNVDEEERQDRTDEARQFYLGLPVTTAALILPAALGLGHRFGFPPDMLAPIVLLLMSLAFLTPFRLKKPALPGKVGVLLCGGAGLVLFLTGVNP